MIFAGSAAVLKAGGFLLSVWVARTLDPDQYGMWGLAYAFQIGIATFGIVGIQESVVGLLQTHSNAPDRQRLFASAIGALATTLSATLVVALCGILLALASRNIGPIGYVGIVVSGGLLTLTTLQAQMSRLEEDHLSSLSFSFAIPCAGVVGSAIAFTIEPSVDAFFAGSGVGLLMAASLLHRQLRGFDVPISQVNDMRKQVLQRISPFILVAFFGWMSGYGSNFFVDRLFGLEDVGKLTFLLTVGSVLQLLTTSLNQVWAPRFYSLIYSQQDRTTIERHNHRFYSVQAWGLGAFAAVCIAGVPHLLNYVGGNLTAYSHMRMEMLLIFASYIVLVPWTHCQNYLLAFDKGKTLMHVVLISSIVGIFIWLVLMLTLGPIGIYLGFFIQMIIRTVGISLSVREWHVRLSWGGTVGGIFLAGTGLLFPNV